MLPLVEQRGIDLGRREVGEVDKARLVRYLADGGCLEEWAKKLEITKTKVRGVAVSHIISCRAAKRLDGGGVSQIPLLSLVVTPR